MRLRNINRGLVLGAVLIVGVSGYEIYQNSAFKKSKPEIEKLTHEITEEMGNASVGDDKAVKDNWTKLIDKYFTEYQNDMDFGFTRSDYTSAAKDNIDNKFGKVTAAETKLADLKVSKYGNNGAMVTFEWTGYFEYEGYDINIPAIAPYGVDINCSEDHEQASEKHKNDKGSNTFETSVQMYLQKKQDGWKIASIETYGISTSGSSSFEDNAEEESNESQTSGKGEA